MRSKFLILFLLAFVVNVSNLHAFEFTPEICQKYGLGDSWYCGKVKNTEQEPDSNSSINTIMKMEVPPEQKAVLLNELWERQNKRAVITGDKQDLEQLLITQRFIAQKGSDFARNMARLVETNPEFSNSESYYKNISDQYIERAEKEQLLKSSHKRYLLAFVYSSGCPYCQRQLPIIFSLQEQFGIKLLGVSVDGEFYSELEDNVYDSGVASDPNIKAYPTMLLVDKEKNERIFVAKGVTTKDELENRIYKILKERSDDRLHTK